MYACTEIYNNKYMYALTECSHCLDISTFMFHCYHCYILRLQSPVQQFAVRWQHHIYASAEEGDGKAQLISTIILRPK